MVPPTFFGTSDKRYSVGQTYDGTGLHGLFYAAGRTFVTYDFPGVSFVELTGINNTGFICGHGYDTTSGMTHSYIVRVQASRLSSWADQATVVRFEQTSDTLHGKFRSKQAPAAPNA